MSSEGDRMASASKSPIHSPFANAPILSPPSSRNKAPIRKPLHERTSSQDNRDSGPTIRIVAADEDPSQDVYSKTPFPSQASQILPGRKRPGYAFEGRGARVSSAGYVANVVSKFEAGKAPVSQPIQSPKAVRHSTSTSISAISDADTIIAASISPSNSRFSQGSTAPSSIYTPTEEKTLESLEEESFLSEQPTIRAVPPSSHGIRAVPPSRDGPGEDHALTPRASAASLASSASSGDLTYRPGDDEPGSSENIQTFPGSSDHSSSENGSSENLLTFPASSNNSSSENIKTFPRGHQYSSSENIQTFSGSSNNSLSENIQTFRRGHRHSSSFGSFRKKQASYRNRVDQKSPRTRASSESFAYSSDASQITGSPRSTSHPSPKAPATHDARHITLADGVRLQYPIVRAPSGSSLWAEPRILPKNPSRMNPRTAHVHQWSSQLSTIASESERASRSIERQSQSLDGRSHSTEDISRIEESREEYPTDGRTNIPRRRATISSISSEENGNASSNTESTVPVPRPLFSPVTRTTSEERNSDELQDTLAELQSPPLRLKHSFLRRSDSDSNRSSRSVSSVHSDFSTFITNTIPTWARVYYSRGSRVSLGTPMSMTESTESLRLPTATSGRTQTPSESNFPLSIYRPRNRPHERMSNTDTISISEEPLEDEEEQQVYVVESHRRAPEISYTPRLRQDRRSQARLSAWKAPSLDESLGRLFFSRQNRQISLFCLGFIFPLAWIIASFLTLPPNPELSTPTPSQMDVERQFVSQGIAPIDDRSHRKAMWWRNLNRIMAALGTLLIGVIIALAILASRMS